MIDCQLYFEFVARADSGRRTTFEPGCSVVLTLPLLAPPRRGEILSLGGVDCRVDLVVHYVRLDADAARQNVVHSIRLVVEASSQDLDGAKSGIDAYYAVLGNYLTSLRGHVNVEAWPASLDE